MNDKPDGWMRRWAYDGETPKKIKNKWPQKFKFRAVTEGKFFDDDVPLYAKRERNYERKKRLAPERWVG